MDNDLRSLVPGSEFTRRKFVVTMLAAGFAAAVRPIAAQTVIHTDSAGLIEGEIKIPTLDGAMPAYRAMPAQGVTFPVVLVVQEIFGVHEHIRDICRRLAKLGYFAIAPELFARQGDVSKMNDIKEILDTIVSQVADAQVLADLDATAHWATKNGGDAKRLAVTGFCWGGRVTWLYAAHNPKLKAAVAWYGRVAGTADKLHPAQPLDVAQSIKVPVLGLYGGADQGIPVNTLESMRARLKESGGKSEIVIYPEAPHAFHADYRPSYREAPAKDGWKRMQEWLKKNGA